MSVLVTGASRGVGAAVCRRLNGPILGIYRADAAAAERVASDCPSARMIAADLTTASGRQRVCDAASGGLDGVVLSAGVMCSGPLRSAAEADVAAAIETNLVSPLQLLRELRATDCLRPGASVVWVGSNLAQRGLPDKAAYAASKAGVEGAVRALAREWGPEVRVNAVAPGLLRTDMTAAYDEAVFDACAQDTPMGRVGTTADVAGVIAFLLGADAGWVTGQTWTVDGGWTV